MSTGVLKAGSWWLCYEVWLSFASRKEIYGMTSTFENEAIRYCFLNAHQHLVWCSYRAIRICLAEW